MTSVHLVHPYRSGEIPILSVEPQSKTVLIFWLFLSFTSCGQKAENEQILWEQVLKVFVICFVGICMCFLLFRSFLSSGEE